MSKLKIGLLLDGYQMPAWTLRMLEQILQDDYAEIALIVLYDSGESRLPHSPLKRPGEDEERLPATLIRHGLARIYASLIERQPSPPDACAVTDAGSLLVDVPTLTVKTVRKGACDHLLENDLEAVRRYDLDILYHGSSKNPGEDISGAARFGVWAIRHGDDRINHGGPPGYWESMESWPETGSTLQILTEDPDNHTVLYRSLSCTDDLSVHGNCNNYLWKTSSFLPRKLRELHQVGGEAFLARVQAENRHPTFYSRRLYTQPTNRELMILTARKLAQKSSRMVSSRLSFEQWILMFQLADRLSTSMWRYKPMIPPPDHFWADPHVIDENGMYFIFIEELPYRTWKGHISLITMDAQGNYTEPEVLIDRPYHLSYPFVFEYNGSYYMIPESKANRTIELYKAMDFPHGWEFQRNLMEDVVAVDSTLLFYKDRWWLFANMIETPGASLWDELFLFSSDDPLSSRWTPHPANPIVSDCGNSRPAGRIFALNGELYRPSQNCSHKYGYGFNINHITRLDETSYEESVVSSVEPNWDRRITGTHTFNRAGSLHIIDALYRRWRFPGKGMPRGYS